MEEVKCLHDFQPFYHIHIYSYSILNFSTNDDIFLQVMIIDIVKNYLLDTCSKLAF